MGEARDARALTEALLGGDLGAALPLIDLLAEAGQPDLADWLRGEVVKLCCRLEQPPWSQGEAWQSFHWAVATGLWLELKGLTLADAVRRAASKANLPSLEAWRRAGCLPRTGGGPHWNSQRAAEGAPEPGGEVAV